MIKVRLLGKYGQEGYHFQIDEDKYDLVKLGWYGIKRSDKIYVCRKNHQKREYLAQMILGLSQTQRITYKDSDSLNLTTDNLILANRSIQARYKKKIPKHVYYSKPEDIYYGQIKLYNKHYTTKRFKSPEQAKEAIEKIKLELNYYANNTRN